MKKALALFLAVLFLGAASCASTQKNIGQDEAGAAPQQGQAKPAGKPSDESASGASLIGAIEQSAKKIAETLRKGSRVAIVAFESESDNLSDFIMEEFTGALVDRGIEVADRQNLDYLENELKFQMSGAVSDEDVKRVGQFLAADMVVTGQLLNVGKTYRYRTNAIHLEEATRAAVTRLDVPNDAEMQNMVAALAGQRTSVKTARYGAERKTPGSNLDCGILFLNRKNYEMAINCFTQTIMQNPDMAVAYFYRGRVYDQMGNFWKTVEDFNEALRLNPGLAEVYYYRAVAYSDLRREHNLDKAASDLNEAIRLNPNYTEAYIFRGCLHNSNKNGQDLAIADFDQAIRLSPNDARLYSHRGSAYFKKEDFSKAIADYGAAIKLNPNDTASYVKRVEAYLKKGDLDKAIADYGQLIRLKPDDHLFYDSRAKAYYEKGDYDKAIADFGEAIRLFRGFADKPGLQYFNRGNAYRKKGDINKAIADYREAQRIYPNREDIKQTLEAVSQQSPAAAQAPDTRWYAANPKAVNFTISTASELAGFAQIVNGTWGGMPNMDNFSGKTIKLANNIDLSGYDNWIPIGGGRENPFSGAFLGNSRVISKLTIKNRKGYNGLFGYIEGGKVVNLGLEGVSISGSGSPVGGIAASIVRKGGIVKCYTTGEISGYGSAGGVAGSVYDSSSITGSYSSAAVSGETKIGGVAGSLDKYCSITDSYSTGAVNGKYDDIGGIAGRVSDGNKILNCYSTGAVKGSDDVGGIAGYLGDNSSIANCYSTGAISGKDKTGGLVGLLRGSRAANSYSTGAVSGHIFVGGIAGDIWEKGQITDCAALNSEVKGGDPNAVGRVSGKKTNALSNNAANAQMKNKAGNTEWKNKSADNMDGDDITAAEIKSDGTIGRRFKPNNDYWTTEKGKLPGLGGKAAAMPEHLRN